jgi:hypothetical protein
VGYKSHIQSAYSFAEKRSPKLRKLLRS